MIDTECLNEFVAPAPVKDPFHRGSERILLAHGGGGELMSRLIRTHLVPALHNEFLSPLTDGAVVPSSDGSWVFTTDSYVVSPLEFPGGDIGRLAVCGTVNDLAVMGATPKALSLAMIAEEGLSMATLDRVIASVAAAAREASVPVVTGDTKVIEHRVLPLQSSADGGALYLTTAGIGYRHTNLEFGLAGLTPGDAIVVNGGIAEHGLAVMSVRHGIEFESRIRSDVAPLNHLIAAVLESGARVKFMRDPTRGGLASVLVDIAEGSNLSVEVDENRIPLSVSTRHAADVLGLDPLTIANEGKVVCVVAESDLPAALGIMRKHALGRHAACIGTVVARQPPLVELITRSGGRRIVQRPYGEDLPRIC